MPPKRKSDALDDADAAVAPAPAVAPAKRARVSKKKVNAVADADADGDGDYADDVPEASTSKGKKKAKVQEAPKDYKDIKLDGEDEVWTMDASCFFVVLCADSDATRFKFVGRIGRGSDLVRVFPCVECGETWTSTDVAMQ